MPRKDSDTTGTTLRDEIYPILECFYDIPLTHACKFLAMSAHTVKKMRVKKGIQKWPFDEIRRRNFWMTWDQIKERRRQEMDNCSYEIRQILEKVDMQAHLMKKIFTQGDHETSNNLMIQVLQQHPQTVMQAFQPPSLIVTQQPQFTMPRPPIVVQKSQSKTQAMAPDAHVSTAHDGLYPEYILPDQETGKNTGLTSEAQPRKMTREECENLFLWEDTDLDDSMYGQCTDQEISNFQSLLHENGYESTAQSPFSDLLDDEGILEAQTKANAEWLGVDDD